MKSEDASCNLEETRGKISETDVPIVTTKQESSVFDSSSVKDLAKKMLPEKSS